MREPFSISFGVLVENASAEKLLILVFEILFYALCHHFDDELILSLLRVESSQLTFELIS